MTLMKKVALYARTSTADRQDPEVQLRELREYASIRGWQVSGVYEDRGYTGTNTNRPQLKQLMHDAKSRKFDLVLVWRLDRWGRSLREIVLMLQELADHSVEFCSLKDSIDLSTSHGRLLMHLLAAFAQFEADVIKARVRAGLDNARAKGKRLGRPKTRDDVTILKLRQAGLSYSEIQTQTGCERSAIYRALKAVGKTCSKQAFQVAEKSKHGKCG